MAYDMRAHPVHIFRFYRNTLMCKYDVSEEAQTDYVDFKVHDTPLVEAER